MNDLVVLNKYIYIDYMKEGIFVFYICESLKRPMIC
jgi:hypothetical protein